MYIERIGLFALSTILLYDGWRTWPLLL